MLLLVSSETGWVMNLGLPESITQSLCSVQNRITDCITLTYPSFSTIPLLRTVLMSQPWKAKKLFAFEVSNVLAESISAKT